MKMGEQQRTGNSFHGWLSMAVSGNEKVSIKSRRLAKSRRLSILNIHARWNRSSDSPPRIPSPPPLRSLSLSLSLSHSLSCFRFLLPPPRPSPVGFLTPARRASARADPKPARYSPVLFAGSPAKWDMPSAHSRAIIQRDARCVTRASRAGEKCRALPSVAGNPRL